MATIRQRSSGSWEVIIRSKSLPRPYYATLDSEAEAREYAAKLEARIARGDIPPELLTIPVAQQALGGLIIQYLAGARVSVHDTDVLQTFSDTIREVRVDQITVKWCLNWVAALQREGLAPGTIRKKVGALARCLDWAVLTERGIVANPVRELPRNYAAYPVAHDQRREDVERDRRLQEGEENRIRKVIAGRNNDAHEWALLFDLAIETAMRLREIFTLDWSQIDLDRRTIFLDRTKNGDKRQVPLSSTAIVKLTEFGIGEGRLFSWWDGHQATLKNTTCRLSHQWTRIVRDAGCADLHFHDLRHEATCRLYERTKLSDVQIARITGHRSLQMLKRYASLRGSDLAGQLW